MKSKTGSVFSTKEFLVQYSRQTNLVKDAPIFSEHPFTSPTEAVAVLGELMSEFDREVVCVINLRSDLKPINVHFASIGALNEAMAHPQAFYGLHKR